MIHSVRGIILHRRISPSRASSSPPSRTVAGSAFWRRAPAAGGACSSAARAVHALRPDLLRHPRRGLNILGECDILDSFEPLRTDLSRFALACSLAGLVDAGRGSPRNPLRSFAPREALRPPAPTPTLGSSGPASSSALTILGYSLRLDRCVSCHSTAGVRRVFSAAAGDDLRPLRAPVPRRPRRHPRHRGVSPPPAPDAPDRGVPRQARPAAGGGAAEMLRRAILFHLDIRPRAAVLLAPAAPPATGGSPAPPRR